MNIKTTTYKAKFLIVITSFLFFGIFSYLFSIRKTIKLTDKNEHLTIEIEQAQDASGSLKLYESKIQQWNESFITTFNNAELQVKIFNQISNLCKLHNCNIISLSKAESVIKNDIEIGTHIIVIEGSFNATIKIINTLENNMKFAKISTADFQTVKNRKKKKEELYLTMYLQSAIKNKHYE